MTTNEPAAAEETGAHRVLPFWLYLPRLVLAPLQRAALTRIVVAAVVLAVISWVLAGQFATAALRSASLLFVAACATSLYVAQFGFLMIERTATGYLDARAYPKVSGSIDWQRLGLTYVVTVIAPAVVIVPLVVLAPALVGFTALVLFALVLPALFIVVSTPGNAIDGTVAVKCVRTVTRIGWPYLLLAAGAFLLLLAIGLLKSVVVPGAGAGTGGAAAQVGAAHVVSAAFVLSLFGNYCLVLLCALAGYAMYQYSEELEISVIGPGSARAHGPVSSTTHKRREREALIARLIAGGEFREASELISDDLRERPNDLSLHVRLHKLLQQQGSKPLIETHAMRYLELLVAASSWKDALALYEETKKAFPSFAPRDASYLPRLAGAALDAMKTDLAAEMIRGFDKKYPGHQSIPDVYVIGARIMLQSGHEREARRILKHVISAFPSGPALTEAKRYLARFDVQAGPATIPGGPPTMPGGPATVPTKPAPTSPAQSTAPDTQPVRSAAPAAVPPAPIAVAPAQSAISPASAAIPPAQSAMPPPATVPTAQSAIAPAPATEAPEQFSPSFERAPITIAPAPAPAAEARASEDADLPMSTIEEAVAAARVPEESEGPGAPQELSEPIEQAAPESALPAAPATINESKAPTDRGPSPPTLPGRRLGP